MHIFAALGDKKKDIFFSTSGVEISINVDCFDKLNCPAPFFNLIPSIVYIANISP